MAHGRMVSQNITRDKKVNELSSDFCRLVFTWIIPFLDVEGRMPGDPAIVRSMLFPRREDITIKQMEECLGELNRAGLIVWYNAKDDLWIYFPSFAEDQPGLRKEREPKSTIPAPAPEGCQQPCGEMPEECRQTSDNLTAECRQNDGNLTANIPLKLIKVKLKEVEVNENPEKTTPTPPENFPEPSFPEDVIPELEKDDHPRLSPLSVAFTNATQIPELTGGPQKAVQALQKMQEAGVTPEDVIQAVDDMRNKGYTIVNLGSIVNPAITAMSRRKQQSNAAASGFAKFSPA